MNVKGFKLSQVARVADVIRIAQREAMEKCLVIAEEYPEVPEVAKEIRALIAELGEE